MINKLIIQIPCYNEEKALPVTLENLPRELPGVNKIEWLIVDDGSRDATVAVAKAHGVDHIIHHPRNQGLARAFMSGLEACIQLGADIIVNTDADNQYCAADIPKLIAPIIAGEAQIVIGERPIGATAHFSAVKKFLQKLGSRVVRQISRTNIPDAPSGFRAISLQAAMQLHVFSEYTYTLETIIQAGHKGIAITSVPIRINNPMRPSRLISGMFRYVVRSGITIIRIFYTYQPFAFFVVPGFVSLGLGVLIGLRFLYFFFSDGGQGHIQSLILTAILVSAGLFLIVVGLLADLVSVNRKLLERLDWQVQVMARKAVADRQNENAPPDEPRQKDA